MGFRASPHQFINDFLGAFADRAVIGGGLHGT
jgi:hypothetical protein